MEEMAAEAGVPHPRLIGQYLRGGALMCGGVPRSGLYGRTATAATKTVADADVLKAAWWSKKVIKATTRPCADPRVDEAVLSRTEEEVTEGKAVGPLTEAEVDRALGEEWVLARSRPCPVIRSAPH